MAQRCVPLYIIACAIAPLCAQPMFEGASAFGGEELKGRPKLVVVEREKLADGAVRLPEEESTYREDGKLLSHKRFIDGKLVSNETFEYSASGHRTAIHTRDAEGKLVRTQSFRRLADESEEEIAEAGQKQQSRTIRRFDPRGRVVELKTLETGGGATIMQFEYDERGRPLEGKVRMGDERSNELSLRIQISYLPGDQAIVTVYGAAGEILLQLQTKEDAAGNEMAQVLFELDPQGKPANLTRIEQRDANGNWTLQTLLERNPRTQADEAVARLHRSIVYY